MMAFISLPFLGFLGIVCAAGYLVPARVRYLWLLAASYLFYTYTPSGIADGLPALGVLLFATLVGYVCALCIAGAKKKGVKVLFLTVAVFCFLALLLVFKYLGFFPQLLTATGFSAFALAKPLGLSYFTLQSIGYVADVYRGTVVPEKNPLRYALFVSFFPAIVAGPINRAADMLPQYTNPAPFEYARLAGGAFRILWGVFKKLVIADLLFPFTAGVFASPSSFDGPVVVLASLVFVFQLYVDFSALCDIALGAAYMMGFTMMENFQNPFGAGSFPELMGRWHISLASFFQDNVMAPIMGRAKTRKAAAGALGVLLAYLLMGLWHGPSLAYLGWGLACGALVAIASLLAPKKEKIVSHIPVYRAKFVRGVIQRIIVYILFAACGILFAAGWFSFSLAQWGQGAFYGWADLGSIPSALAQYGIEGPLLWVLPAAILLVVVIEAIATRPGRNVAIWIRSTYFFLRWPLYFLLLLALLFFGVLNGPAFIYPQF